MRSSRVLASLAAVVLALTGTGLHATAAAAQSTAFAGFRVVRTASGTATAPEITLPPGYVLAPNWQYQVLSPAEFTGFVQGPPAAAVTVSVRWPGERITAVVAGETRPAMTVDPADPARVSFTLPVNRSSPVADSTTVQVFSHLRPTGSGAYWRVEHNDPDRVVGYWASRPFPAGEAAAVVNWMVAAEAVLRDSGLAEQARLRGHFFAVMGFETNNLMHQDNPPHWHLSYWPGPTWETRGITVPHFWVDGQGRTFYNGQDVQGRPRDRYHAGEPAPIHAPDGTLVVTTTIRPDGGLDIDPPAGPRYSIVAADGDFTDGVEVHRAGLPWRTVAGRDDVRAGILRTEVVGVGGDRSAERVEYRYDPLTGPVVSTRRY